MMTLTMGGGGNAMTFVAGALLALSAFQVQRKYLALLSSLAVPIAHHMLRHWIAMATPPFYTIPAPDGEVEGGGGGRVAAESELELGTGR